MQCQLLSASAQDVEGTLLAQPGMAIKQSCFYEDGIHIAHAGCRPTAGLAKGTLDMLLKRALICCSPLTSRF